MKVQANFCLLPTYPYKYRALDAKDAAASISFMNKNVIIIIKMFIDFATFKNSWKIYSSY